MINLESPNFFFINFNKFGQFSEVNKNSEMTAIILFRYFKETS